MSLKENSTVSSPSGVQFKNDVPRLAWLGIAVASALLSLVTILSPSVVNDDGIFYLLVAERYSQGGMVQAFEAYPWPFYSAVVAELSRIGLSMEMTAKLLNLLASMILALGFVKASLRITQNQRSWLIAAILVLALPALNVLRDELVRDVLGLSIWMWFCERLLTFNVSPRWYVLGQAVVLLMLSMLFRVEYVVFFLAVPVSVFYCDQISRAGKQGFAFATAVAVCAFFILFPAFSVEVKQTRLHEIFLLADKFDGLKAAFELRAQHLADAVLPDVMQNYQKEALLAVFLIMLIGKWLKAFTWVHALVWFSKPSELGVAVSEQRKVWWTMLLLSMLPPLYIIVKEGLITTRYVLPTALVCLLALPNVYYFRWTQLGEGGKRVALALFIGLVVMGNVSEFSGKKTASRSAGEWLASQSGEVWCNERALCYFSGRHTIERDRQYPWREALQRLPNELDGIQWVAVYLRARERSERQNLESVLQLKPTLQFDDRDGGMVLIFDRRDMLRGADQ